MPFTNNASINIKNLKRAQTKVKSYTAIIIVNIHLGNMLTYINEPEGW